MKKITFLIVAVLIATTSFGQRSFKVQEGKTHFLNANNAFNKLNTTSENAAKLIGATIFSSDFSDPTQWTIANSAGNSDNWVIGTTGPAGSYAIDPILSTTATNGFALFDSDLLCSGNQNANLTTAASFDCSSYDIVRIKFETFYYKYHDKIYVQVSNDGTTWTDFEVFSDYEVNDISENPEVVDMNISSVAANQATVWIRFNFRSMDEGCDYSWMVDDVTVYEFISPTEPEIAVIGSVETNYTIIPVFFTPEYPLKATLSNTGAEINAGQVVNVTEVGGTYTGTGTTLAVIANDGSETVDIAPVFAPTVTGTYKIAFHSDVIGDSDPINNFDTVYVAVSDTVYARDLGPNGGAMGIGDDATGILGQLFLIESDVNLTSVSFMLNEPSATSTTVKVYAYNGTTVTGSELATSASISVVAGTEAMYTASINAFLTAGTYFIGLEEPLAGNITLATSAMPDANSEAWVYYENEWGPASDFGFYHTYVLRANMNITSVGIDANEMATMVVYPNPAKNSIRVESNQTINMVRILNVLGQEVYSEALSNNSTVINVSTLRSGIYFVNIETNEGVKTQRISIVR